MESSQQPVLKDEIEDRKLVLSRYVTAVFRPVLFHAEDDKGREDVERISGAVSLKLQGHFAKTQSEQDVQAGFRTAVERLKELDVLKFRPENYLAGFGIGDEWAKRWRAQLQHVYRRDLVESRIAKAKAAIDSGNWDGVDADYPNNRSDWGERTNRIHDTFEYVEAEKAWASRLRAAFGDLFGPMPPHIQDLHEDADQFYKACCLALDGFQRLQTENEEAVPKLREKWDDEILHRLGDTADRLHRYARIYLDFC